MSDAAIWFISALIVLVFLCLLVALGNRHRHRWSPWGERETYNGNVEYQYRHCRVASCLLTQRRQV